MLKIDHQNSSRNPFCIACTTTHSWYVQTLLLLLFYCCCGTQTIDTHLAMARRRNSLDLLTFNMLLLLSSSGSLFSFLNFFLFMFLLLCAFLFRIYSDYYNSDKAKRNTLLLLSAGKNFWKKVEGRSQMRMCPFHTRKHL